MAFAAANNSGEPRAFSVGPLKVQLMSYSAISGDTSGTVTADKLSSISHILVSGSLALSAAPTFSGNVATLAFTDPVASVFGTIQVWGR